MIIAIGGKKRSGKDTIANYIIENYDGFDKYSLAKPMKDVMGEIFDWGNDHLYGDLKEVVDPRWGISPRQALQNFGTEWGQYGLSESFPEFKRVTGRNLWINKFLIWYKAHDALKNVVIPDLRFYHEYEKLREHGNMTGEPVFFIRVLRDLENKVDGHESEQQANLRFCDVTIVNDGTIEELESNVKVFMEASSHLIHYGGLDI
jgi:hypothetical protein